MAKKEAHFSKEHTKSSTHIHNMSNYKLSPHETQLLSKNLKFIPTPPPPKINYIKKDIMDFTRRMRIKYRMSEQKNKPINPFKEKYKKIPMPINHSKLEDYLNETNIKILQEARQIKETKIIHKNQFQSLKKKKEQRPNKYTIDNLSKGQRLALHKLSKNKEIVIKKADKTNKITVMNKKDYIKAGEEHLGSAMHYQEQKSIPVNSNPTSNTANEVHNFLNHMLENNEIDRETFNYLDPHQHKIKIPQLYFLQKIHKNPPKGRPIISGCGSPTERISGFVDYFLIPLITKQSTYLRDTAALIEKIENIKIPQNTILVTMDITAMYTNVCHDEAIQAVKSLLQKHTNYIYDINRPSTTSLIKLLEIVLKQNYFQFNNKTYWQSLGAAQGSKVSPEVCDARVHLLENIAIAHAKESILLFLRFRDDIIMFWNNTEEKLNEFLTYINTLHDTLKFTFEYSKSQVTFLDLEIFKGPRFQQTNTLDMRTHTKKIDSFMYLPPTSAHPKSVFKGFLKGETIRHVRNTSNYLEFEEKKSKFQNRLLDRGYKSKETKIILESTDFKHRKHFIQQAGLGKNRKRKNSIPLVFTTTFNPSFQYLHKIIPIHWDEYINQDKELKEIFSDKPMISYRRNKNLGDFLTRAKLE